MEKTPLLPNQIQTESRMKSRYGFWLRAISLTLVVTFFAQDILSAQGGASPAQVKPQTSAPMISSDLGLTRKSSLVTTSQGETIINIQDAHSKLGAQEGISKILDSLVKNYDLQMIALEGASSFVDTSLVSSFPIQKARESVANTLLKEGKISASEFYSMLTKERINLYGVEDPSLYKQNVEVFKDLIEQKPKIRQELKNLKATLKALGDQIYSPKLKTLLNQRLLHQNGDIKFTEYWDTFSKEAKTQGIDFHTYPNLDRLSKAIELEQTIDFKQAGVERDLLIESLGKTLEKQELQEFILKSLEFKRNKITPTMFHTLLLNKAATAGLDLKVYPNLKSYTEYVGFYELIDLIQIFDEVENFEQALREKLFENDTQRTLSSLHKCAAILSQLLDTTLTSKDYLFFIQNQPDCEIDQIQKTLQGLTETYKVQTSVDFDYLRTQIPSAKKFYELAEARNKALLENTLKKMRESGQKIAALVTGGFHSEGISELMDQNKLSYLVVMPKFDEKSPDRPYFTILTQKPREYEEQFKDSEEWTVAAAVLFDVYEDPANAFWTAKQQIDFAQGVVRDLISEFRQLEPNKDPREVIKDFAANYRKVYEERGKGLVTPEQLEQWVEASTPILRPLAVSAPAPERIAAARLSEEKKEATPDQVREIAQKAIQNSVAAAKTNPNLNLQHFLSTQLEIESRRKGFTLSTDQKNRIIGQASRLAAEAPAPVVTAPKKVITEAPKIAAAPAKKAEITQKAEEVVVPPAKFDSKKMSSAVFHAVSTFVALGAISVVGVALIGHTLAWVGFTALSSLVAGFVGYNRPPPQSKYSAQTLSTLDDIKQLIDSKYTNLTPIEKKALLELFRNKTNITGLERINDAERSYGEAKDQEAQKKAAQTTFYVWLTIAAIVVAYPLLVGLGFVSAAIFGTALTYGFLGFLGFMALKEARSEWIKSKTEFGALSAKTLWNTFKGFSNGVVHVFVGLPHHLFRGFILGIFYAKIRTYWSPLFSYIADYTVSSVRAGRPQAWAFSDTLANQHTLKWFSDVELEAILDTEARKLEKAENPLDVQTLVEKGKFEFRNKLEAEILLLGGVSEFLKKRSTMMVASFIVAHLLPYLALVFTAVSFAIRFQHSLSLASSGSSGRRDLFFRALLDGVLLGTFLSIGWFGFIAPTQGLDLGFTVQTPDLFGTIPTQDLHFTARTFASSASTLFILNLRDVAKTTRKNMFQSFNGYLRGQTGLQDTLSSFDVQSVSDFSARQDGSSRIKILTAVKEALLSKNLNKLIFSFSGLSAADERLTLDYIDRVLAGFESAEKTSASQAAKDFLAQKTFSNYLKSGLAQTLTDSQFWFKIVAGTPGMWFVQTEIALVVGMAEVTHFAPLTAIVKAIEGDPHRQHTLGPDASLREQIAAHGALGFVNVISTNFGIWTGIVKDIKPVDSIKKETIQQPVKTEIPIEPLQNSQALSLLEIQKTLPPAPQVMPDQDILLAEKASPEAPESLDFIAKRESDELYAVVKKLTSDLENAKKRLDQLNAQNQLTAEEIQELKQIFEEIKNVRTQAEEAFSELKTTVGYKVEKNHPVLESERPFYRASSELDKSRVSLEHKFPILREIKQKPQIKKQETKKIEPVNEGEQKLKKELTQAKNEAKKAGVPEDHVKNAKTPAEVESIRKAWLKEVDAKNAEIKLTQAKDAAKKAGVPEDHVKNAKTPAEVESIRKAWLKEVAEKKAAEEAAAKKAQEEAAVKPQEKSRDVWQDENAMGVWVSQEEELAIRSADVLYKWLEIQGREADKGGHYALRIPRVPVNEQGVPRQLFQVSYDEKTGRLSVETKDGLDLLDAQGQKIDLGEAPQFLTKESAKNITIIYRDASREYTGYLPVGLDPRDFKQFDSKTGEEIVFLPKSAYESSKKSDLDVEVVQNQIKAFQTQKDSASAAIFGKTVYAFSVDKDTYKIKDFYTTPVTDEQIAAMTFYYRDPKTLEFSSYAGDDLSMDPSKEPEQITEKDGDLVFFTIKGHREFEKAVSNEKKVLERAIESIALSAPVKLEDTFAPSLKSQRTIADLQNWGIVDAEIKIKQEDKATGQAKVVDAKIDDLSAEQYQDLVDRVREKKFDFERSFEDLVAPAYRILINVKTGLPMALFEEKKDLINSLSSSGTSSEKGGVNLTFDSNGQLTSYDKEGFSLNDYLTDTGLSSAIPGIVDLVKNNSTTEITVKSDPNLDIRLISSGSPLFSDYLMKARGVRTDVKIQLFPDGTRKVFDGSDPKLQALLQSTAQDELADFNAGRRLSIQIQNPDLPEVDKSLIISSYAGYEKKEGTGEVTQVYSRAGDLKSRLNDRTLTYSGTVFLKDAKTGKPKAVAFERIPWYEVAKYEDRAFISEIYDPSKQTIIKFGGLYQLYEYIAKKASFEAKKEADELQEQRAIITIDKKRPLSSTKKQSSGDYLNRMKEKGLMEQRLAKQASLDHAIRIVTQELEALGLKIKDKATPKAEIADLKKQVKDKESEKAKLKASYDSLKKRMGILAQDYLDAKDYNNDVERMNFKLFFDSTNFLIFPDSDDLVVLQPSIGDSEEDLEQDLSSLKLQERIEHMNGLPGGVEIRYPKGNPKQVTVDVAVSPVSKLQRTVDGLDFTMDYKSMETVFDVKHFDSTVLDLALSKETARELKTLLESLEKTRADKTKAPADVAEIEYQIFKLTVAERFEDYLTRLRQELNQAQSKLSPDLPAYTAKKLEKKIADTKQAIQKSLDDYSYSIPEDLKIGRPEREIRIVAPRDFAARYRQELEAENKVREDYLSKAQRVRKEGGFVQTELASQAVPQFHFGEEELKKAQSRGFKHLAEINPELLQLSSQIEGLTVGIQKIAAEKDQAEINKEELLRLWNRASNGLDDLSPQEKEDLNKRRKDAANLFDKLAREKASKEEILKSAEARLKELDRQKNRILQDSTFYFEENGKKYVINWFYGENLTKARQAVQKELVQGSADALTRLKNGFVVLDRKEKKILDDSSDSFREHALKWFSEKRKTLLEKFEAFSENQTIAKELEEKLLRLHAGQYQPDPADPDFKVTVVGGFEQALEELKKAKGELISGGAVRKRLYDGVVPTAFLKTVVDGVLNPVDRYEPDGLNGQKFTSHGGNRVLRQILNEQGLSVNDVESFATGPGNKLEEKKVYETSYSAEKWAGNYVVKEKRTHAFDPSKEGGKGPVLAVRTLETTRDDYEKTKRLKYKYARATDRGLREDFVWYEVYDEDNRLVEIIQPDQVLKLEYPKGSKWTALGVPEIVKTFSKDGRTLKTQTTLPDRLKNGADNYQEYLTKGRIGLKIDDLEDHVRMEQVKNAEDLTVYTIREYYSPKTKEASETIQETTIEYPSYENLKLKSLGVASKQEKFVYDPKVPDFKGRLLGRSEALDREAFLGIEQIRARGDLVPIQTTLKGVNDTVILFIDPLQDKPVYRLSIDKAKKKLVFEDIKARTIYDAKVKMGGTGGFEDIFKEASKEYLLAAGSDGKIEPDGKVRFIKDGFTIGNQFYDLVELTDSVGNPIDIFAVNRATEARVASFYIKPQETVLSKGKNAQAVYGLVEIDHNNLYGFGSGVQGAGKYAGLGISDEEVRDIEEAKKALKNDQGFSESEAESSKLIFYFNRTDEDLESKGYQYVLTNKKPNSYASKADVVVEGIPGFNSKDYEFFVTSKWLKDKRLIEKKNLKEKEEEDVIRPGENPGFNLVHMLAVNKETHEVGAISPYYDPKDKEYKIAIEVIDEDGGDRRTYFARWDKKAKKIIADSTALTARVLAPEPITINLGEKLKDEKTEKEFGAISIRGPEGVEDVIGKIETILKGEDDSLSFLSPKNEGFVKKVVKNGLDEISRTLGKNPGTQTELILTKVEVEQGSVSYIVRVKDDPYIGRIVMFISKNQQGTWNVIVNDQWKEQNASRGFEFDGDYVWELKTEDPTQTLSPELKTEDPTQTLSPEQLMDRVLKRFINKDFPGLSESEKEKKVADEKTGMMEDLVIKGVPIDVKIVETQRNLLLDPSKKEASPRFSYSKSYLLAGNPFRSYYAHLDMYGNVRFVKWNNAQNGSSPIIAYNLSQGEQVVASSLAEGGLAKETRWMGRDDKRHTYRFQIMRDITIEGEKRQTRAEIVYNYQTGDVYEVYYDDGYVLVSNRDVPMASYKFDARNFNADWDVKEGGKRFDPQTLSERNLYSTFTSYFLKDPDTKEEYMLVKETLVKGVDPIGKPISVLVKNSEIIALWEGDSYIKEDVFRKNLRAQKIANGPLKFFGFGDADKLSLLKKRIEAEGYALKKAIHRENEILFSEWLRASIDSIVNAPWFWISGIFVGMNFLARVLSWIYEKIFGETFSTAWARRTWKKTSPKPLSVPRGIAPAVYKKLKSFELLSGMGLNAGGPQVPEADRKKVVKQVLKANRFNDAEIQQIFDYFSFTKRDFLGETWEKEQENLRAPPLTKADALNQLKVAVKAGYERAVVIQDLVDKGLVTEAQFKEAVKIFSRDGAIEGSPVWEGVMAQLVAIAQRRALEQIAQGNYDLLRKLPLTPVANLLNYLVREGHNKGILTKKAKAYLKKRGELASLYEFVQLDFLKTTLRKPFDDIFDKTFAGKVNNSDRDAAFDRVFNEIHPFILKNPSLLKELTQTGDMVYKPTPMLRAIEPVTFRELVLLKLIQLNPSQTGSQKGNYNSIGQFSAIWPFAMFVVRKVDPELKSVAKTQSARQIQDSIFADIHKLTNFLIPLLQRQLGPDKMKVITEREAGLKEDSPQTLRELFIDTDFDDLFEILGQMDEKSDALTQFWEIVDYFDTSTKDNQALDNSARLLQGLTLREFRKIHSEATKLDKKTGFWHLMKDRVFIFASVKHLKSFWSLQERWMGTYGFYAAIAAGVVLTAVLYLSFGVTLSPLVLTLTAPLLTLFIFGGNTSLQDRVFFGSISTIAWLANFGVILYMVFPIWTAITFTAGGFWATMTLIVLISPLTWMSFFHVGMVVKSWFILHDEVWSKTSRSLTGLSSLDMFRGIEIILRDLGHVFFGQKSDGPLKSDSFWEKKFLAWFSEMLEAQKTRHKPLISTGETVQEYLLRFIDELRRKDRLSDEEHAQWTAAILQRDGGVFVRPKSQAGFEFIRDAFFALSQKKPSVDPFALLQASSTHAQVAGSAFRHNWWNSFLPGTFDELPLKGGGVKKASLMGYVARTHAPEWNNFIQKISLQRDLGLPGGFLADLIALNEFTDIPLLFEKYQLKPKLRLNIIDLMADWLDEIRSSDSSNLQSMSQDTLVYHLALANELGDFEYHGVLLKIARDKNFRSLKQVYEQTKSKKPNSIFVKRYLVYQALVDTKLHHIYQNQTIWAQDASIATKKVADTPLDLKTKTSVIGVVSSSPILPERQFKVEPFQKIIKIFENLEIELIAIKGTDPLRSQLRSILEHLNELNVRPFRGDAHQIVNAWAEAFMQLRYDNFIALNQVMIELGTESHRPLLEQVQTKYAGESNLQDLFAKATQVAEVALLTEEAGVSYSFYDKELDNLVPKNKNSGISNNLHAFGPLSFNYDAFMRTLPGQNVYRLNAVSYQSQIKNPQIAVVNPMMKIWDSQNNAFAVTSTYKASQETWTGDVQRAARGRLTFYGKGIIIPQVVRFFSPPGEDSSAMVKMKTSQPKYTSTQIDWSAFEWGRPTTFAESLVITELRYAYNVTRFLMDRGQFALFFRRDIGFGEKIYHLALWNHYLFAPIALLALLVFPILSPFSALAFLSHPVFFILLASVLMEAINLNNLLRHWRNEGNLWAAIYLTAKDTIAMIPFYVFTPAFFVRGVIYAAMEKFQFLPTIKEEKLQPQDRAGRFFTQMFAGIPAKLTDRWYDGYSLVKFLGLNQTPANSLYGLAGILAWSLAWVFTPQGGVVMLMYLLASIAMMTGMHAYGAFVQPKRSGGERSALAASSLLLALALVFAPFSWTPFFALLLMGVGSETIEALRQPAGLFYSYQFSEIFKALPFTLWLTFRTAPGFTLAIITLFMAPLVAAGWGLPMVIAAIASFLLNGVLLKITDVTFGLAKEDLGKSMSDRYKNFQKVERLKSIAGKLQIESSELKGKTIAELRALIEIKRVELMEDVRPEVIFQNLRNSPQDVTISDKEYNDIFANISPNIPVSEQTAIKFNRTRAKILALIKENTIKAEPKKTDKIIELIDQTRKDQLRTRTGMVVPPLTEQPPLAPAQPQTGPKVGFSDKTFNLNDEDGVVFEDLPEELGAEKQASTLDVLEDKAEDLAKQEEVVEVEEVIKYEEPLEDTAKVKESATQVTAPVVPQAPSPKKEPLKLKTILTLLGLAAASLAGYGVYRMDWVTVPSVEMPKLTLADVIMGGAAVVTLAAVALFIKHHKLFFEKLARYREARSQRLEAKALEQANQMALREAVEYAKKWGLPKPQYGSLITAEEIKKATNLYRVISAKNSLDQAINSDDLDEVRSLINQANETVNGLNWADEEYVQYNLNVVFSAAFQKQNELEVRLKLQEESRKTYEDYIKMQASLTQTFNDNMPADQAIQAGEVEKYDQAILLFENSKKEIEQFIQKIEVLEFKNPSIGSYLQSTKQGIEDLYEYTSSVITGLTNDRVQAGKMKLIIDRRMKEESARQEAENKRLEEDRKRESEEALKKQQEQEAKKQAEEKERVRLEAERKKMTPTVLDEIVFDGNFKIYRKGSNPGLEISITPDALTYRKNISSSNPEGDISKSVFVPSKQINSLVSDPNLINHKVDLSIPGKITLSIGSSNYFIFAKQEQKNPVFFKSNKLVVNIPLDNFQKLKKYIEDEVAIFQSGESAQAQARDLMDWLKPPADETKPEGARLAEDSGRDFEKDLVDWMWELAESLVDYTSDLKKAKLESSKQGYINTLKDLRERWKELEVEVKQGKFKPLIEQPNLLKNKNLKTVEDKIKEQIKKLEENIKTLGGFVEEAPVLSKTPVGVPSGQQGFGGEATIPPPTKQQEKAVGSEIPESVSNRLKSKDFSEKLATDKAGRPVFLGVVPAGDGISAIGGLRNIAIRQNGVVEPKIDWLDKMVLNDYISFDNPEAVETLDGFTIYRFGEKPGTQKDLDKLLGPKALNIILNPKALQFKSLLGITPSSSPNSEDTQIDPSSPNAQSTVIFQKSEPTTKMTKEELEERQAVANLKTVWGDKENAKHLEIIQGANRIISIGDPQGDFDMVIEYLMDAFGVEKETAGNIRKWIKEIDKIKKDTNSDPAKKSSTLRSNMNNIIAMINPKAGDVITFAGDYVDRGKKNVEVIEFLIALSEKAKINKNFKLVLLMGNHDYVWHQFFDHHKSIEVVTKNAAIAYTSGLGKELGFGSSFITPTVNELFDFYGSLSNLKKAGVADFFKGLKQLVVVDERLFAHASLPLQLESVNTLAGIENFYDQILKDNKTVTNTLWKYAATTYPNRLAIDRWTKNPAEKENRNNLYKKLTFNGVTPRLSVFGHDKENGKITLVGMTDQTVDNADVILIDTGLPTYPNKIDKGDYLTWKPTSAKGVVQKVDDQEDTLFTITGWPQNKNFSIKLSVLKGLMKAGQVHFEKSKTSGYLEITKQGVFAVDIFSKNKKRELKTAAARLAQATPTTLKQKLPVGVLLKNDLSREETAQLQQTVQALLPNDRFEIFYGRSLEALRLEGVRTILDETVFDNPGDARLAILKLLADFDQKTFEAAYPALAALNEDNIQSLSQTELEAFAQVFRTNLPETAKADLILTGQGYVRTVGDVIFEAMDPSYQTLVAVSSTPKTIVTSFEVFKKDADGLPYAPRVLRVAEKGYRNILLVKEPVLGVTHDEKAQNLLAEYPSAKVFDAIIFADARRVSDLKQLYPDLLTDEFIVIAAEDEEMLSSRLDNQKLLELDRRADSTVHILEEAANLLTGGSITRAIQKAQNRYSFLPVASKEYLKLIEILRQAKEAVGVAA